MIIQENILRGVHFSKLPSPPLPIWVWGNDFWWFGVRKRKIESNGNFSHPQKIIFNYKSFALNSANKSLKIFNFWGKHFFLNYFSHLPVWRMFFWMSSKGPGLCESWLAKLSASLARLSWRCREHSEGSTSGLTSSRICLCTSSCLSGLLAIFCLSLSPIWARSSLVLCSWSEGEV